MSESGHRSDSDNLTRSTVLAPMHIPLPNTVLNVDMGSKDNKDIGGLHSRHVNGLYILPYCRITLEN